MNLLKIFEFKGLWQSGKKMSAPLGYFRRFTNLYKDKAGRIRHFGRGLGTGNNPTGTFPIATWGNSVFAAVFKGGIFQMVSGDDVLAAFRYFKVGEPNIEISQVFNSDLAKVMQCNESLLVYRPAGNFTTAVVRDKLYFCEYVDKKEFSSTEAASWVNYKTFNLMKFDGMQVSRAGLPTPYFHSTPNNAGNARLRLMYFSIGLDGEPIFSNYLEYKVTAGAIANFSLGAYNGSFLPHTDAIGMAGQTYPSVREENDSLFKFTFRGVFGGIQNYYNKKCVSLIGAAYTPGLGIDFVGSFFSSNLSVGDWLLSCNPTPIAGWVYDAFYFKITQLDTISYLSPKIKAFNGITASWEDLDLEHGPPKGFATMNDFMARLVANKGLSNIWLMATASLDAAGSLPYNVCGIVPILWESNITTTINTAAAPFARPYLGTITSSLIDWYDTTRVKTTFPPVVGITSYTGLLLGFDREAIYFNDTSLGGSTDMVSGFSNFFPAGAEFGEIRAICGSEDFLFVSRERKNYVLRGELTTGNYVTIECDTPVPGAANAGAVTNAFSGKVIFMNSSGVYQVDASGRITDISLPIKDLFLGKSEDNNLFDPSFMKTPSSKRFNGYDNGFIRIALDEVRGFVLFLTGEFNVGSTTVKQSNLLVYDTNDGSWYEWTGEEATALESLEGVTYLYGTLQHVEDGVCREETLMATQWIHLGEPSLEKQVNQVKIYGKFPVRSGQPNSGGATIGQQNNWKKLNADASTSEFNTYVKYPKTGVLDQTIYAHKQRLDSSRPQVTSIIIHDSTDGFGGMEIEGLEVELETIQTGVKK